MTIPKRAFDRPAVIVDPRSEYLGQCGHIVADNRSKDNTVKISLINGDMKLHFDAGSERFPPQFVVINHSMLALDGYSRSLPAKRERLRTFLEGCIDNPPIYGEAAELLVFRFLALVEQSDEDDDVDVETTEDPEAVYKLLRTRNILRSAWNSKLIEAIPEWSLPEWEKQGAKPRRY